MRQPCSKCGGSTYKEIDEDRWYWHCLNCGDRRDAGEPTRKNTDVLSAKGKPPVKATIQLSSDDPASRIPPKPTTEGMRCGERNMLLHLYYKRWKKPILKDDKEIGATLTSKKWGIASTTLVRLREMEDY